MAMILSDLERADLNPANLHGAGLGGLFLDPRIQAAGSGLLSFSEQQRHYTIGG